MYREWIDILENCSLFQGIQIDELNVMLKCINPKVSRHNKNECIVMAGESSSGVGIILSGQALVVKDNSAGNRIIMAMIEPGDIFGEMVAFSDIERWPDTVIAQTNCVSIFIPSQKIIGECEKMCISHRLLIENMLKIVSNKALMLNRQVEYLAIRNIRGKISYFLLEQHKTTGKLMFMMPLNRNELADFLSISRPSLSREMCKMRDEGIIDFHRSSVSIRDIGALKNAIE